LRLDSLVLKRFAELENNAEAVSKAKEHSFTGTDGKRYCEVPAPLFRGWVVRVLNLLQRIFGEDSIHCQQFKENSDKAGTIDESDFDLCLSIFQAAKEDYEGGYLFDVRALVKAEVLGDALEQAEEILSAGYKDPACVVVGIALETTLKEMCTRNGISHGKLDSMNVELRKANVYNMAKQKQITAWADLRNNAAHGKWSEYNNADVKDFLEGTQRFIADFL